jgi:hypothetical protein
VGKKTYEKRPTINIQNFELICEDSVKLLGIEIDYQLNFDTHISTICRKASQQLMSGQRAKVKITKNKSMENCKFV